MDSIAELTASATQVIKVGGRRDTASAMLLTLLMNNRHIINEYDVDKSISLSMNKKMATIRMLVWSSAIMSHEILCMPQ